MIRSGHNEDAMIRSGRNAQPVQACTGLKDTEGGGGGGAKRMVEGECR